MWNDYDPKILRNVYLPTFYYIFLFSFFFFFFFFFFWLIESQFPNQGLKALNPNHRATRELPVSVKLSALDTLIIFRTTPQILLWNLLQMKLLLYVEGTHGGKSLLISVGKKLPGFLPPSICRLFPKNSAICARSSHYHYKVQMCLSSISIFFFFLRMLHPDFHSDY